MYWLIGIAIVVLLYFALREFRCWYFKTNKIIRLLEEIKEDIAKGTALEIAEQKMTRLNDIREKVNEMGKNITSQKEDKPTV